MGEYEPRDSRNVTLKQEPAPGEPPRTGPRENETRQADEPRGELDEDERGEQAEQTVPADRQRQAIERERAIEQDARELNAAERLRRDGPA